MNEPAKKLDLILGDEASLPPNLSTALRQSSTVQAVREEFILFGSLGEATYREHAPQWPNNPDYAIQSIREKYRLVFDGSNDQKRRDRLELWQAYDELLKQLSAPSEQLIVEAVYEFVKQRSPLATRELGTVRTGLGLHLTEVTNFCASFLLNEQGRSRFPLVLSDRRCELMTYVVAPLHDILKYLGSRSAQIMPDHEVMTAELVLRTFTGRLANINGKPSVLSPDDVEFIAAVIGDHENIEKEKGRFVQVTSPDPDERAKAMFFVADILTGTIVRMPPNSDRWRIDFAQLDARFIDLYFRHLDPVKGKIFRPEWGVDTVDALGCTLDQLVRNDCDIAGSAPGETVRDTLVRGALMALERAMSEDAARWREALLGKRAKPAKYLDAEQQRRIVEVKERLLAMRPGFN